MLRTNSSNTGGYKEEGKEVEKKTKRLHTTRVQKMSIDKSEYALTLKEEYQLPTV